MGLVKRCHVKGLVLSIVLGLMGFILSFWMPLLGGVTYALLLGIFVSNVLPLQEGYKPGIKFSEKTILSLAIVLIGFNLDIQSLSQISYQTMGLVVLGASAAILLAWVVGAAFRLRPDQRLLIGFGTAICGSSAIAACAPMVTEDEQDIGVAVATVNLLGVIGILVLPLVISTIGFSTIEGGILVGASLQAVGHVVAAGYSMGDMAGELATLVKMGRVSLLIPLVLMLGLLPHKKSSGKVLPAYLIGFIAMAILGSLGIPEPIGDGVKLAGKLTLCTAMAGIGLSIQFKQFVSQGSKILVFGAAVSVLHICFIGLLLKAFGT